MTDVTTQLGDALVGAYRKLPPRSEARVHWEDELRPLLRYRLLCGDVRIVDGGFDTPTRHPDAGLDTTRQIALLDALRAFWHLRSNDAFGHMLLVRSVGIHCGDDRCQLDGLHWHRQSWLDLQGHAHDYLVKREEAAMVFVMSFTVDT